MREGTRRVKYCKYYIYIYIYKYIYIYLLYIIY